MENSFLSTSSGNGTFREDNLTDGKVYSDIKPRGTWSSKRDFLLSCVGMAVGLGNIWRFPYLCYKNGGGGGVMKVCLPSAVIFPLGSALGVNIIASGAFLIPYATFLVFAGIPLFMLEIGLGQYMSLSGYGAWNICPLFQGIGISNVVTCVFMNVYYIIILAWSVYYFGISLTSVLPWSHCNNTWNTPRCSLGHISCNITNSTRSTTNATCDEKTLNTVDPAVEFWERRALQLSSDITDGGGIIWEMALSLFIIWAIIYFCVWKGVKWTGKVVYFTATFPYVILTVLLVRGLTLDGASDGIVYYLKPDVTRLTDVQVWMDGGTQILFSYAVAIGAMITLGSYNTFSNNFYRDCLIISCINSSTSFVGGFAVFSVLGFMAKKQNLPISEVAEAGPGLAFIAYPKAVTQMPLSPLWSALFFLMIILLGMDSQFVGVESVITPITDYFPTYLQRKNRRLVFLAVYCLLSYLVGLSMISRGGMYVFQLFDYYSASGMVLLWVCFWETVAIAWVFGVDRFYDAIEMMIGSRINPWMKYCWKYLTPTLSLGLFVSQIALYKPLTYNKVYNYPEWALVFGLMLALSAMVCLPAVAMSKMLKTPGSIIERWKINTTPFLQKHQIHNTWTGPELQLTSQRDVSI